MVRHVKVFLANQSGAISLLFMLLFPILIIIAGLAVDVSQLNAQKRYVQSQADLAAQSAARFLPDVAKVRKTARDVVNGNPIYGHISLADANIVLGRFAAADGRFTPHPDQTNPTGSTAVRVVVPSPFQPLLLGPLLTENNITLRREAIATRGDIIVYTLRNSLLSIDTSRSVLDKLLGDVLGVKLSANVAGYQGLANARIDIDDLLGLGAEFLDLGVGVGAVTFNDVLDVPIELTKVLGLDPLKMLLTPLKSGSAPKTLRLGDLLQLSPGLAKAHLGDILPDVSISALDLVTAMLGLAGAKLPDEQRVTAGVGLNLGPLAKVTLNVGLLSQPVTVVALMSDAPLPATTIEQANVSLSTNILDLGAIGAPTLLSLDLKLGAIRASAVPLQLTCGAVGAATLAEFTVTPSLADLELDAGVLKSRVDGVLGQILQGILKISINSEVAAKNMVGSPTTLRISQTQYLSGKAIAVPLTGLVKALTDSVVKLLAGLKIEITVLSILPVGAILEAILGDLTRLILKPILTVVSAIVSPIVDALLRVLGIQVLPAELIINDISCSGALVN